MTRFLANGATDMSDEALAKLASDAGDDARLFTLAADISDEASCAKLATLARDKAGRVDGGKHML